MDSGKTPQPRPSPMESRGTDSQDQSSAAARAKLDPSPHGFGLPPADHCRRKASRPGTPATLITVDDLPPLAMQMLQSEPLRPRTYPCVKTPLPHLLWGRRLRSRSYEVVGGPGMARIWDQLSKKIAQMLWIKRYFSANTIACVNM